VVFIERLGIRKIDKTFKFDLHVCAVILSLPKEDKVVNLILILVKHYIFQQCRKNNSIVFQNIIEIFICIQQA
jgi:hypothetical protein